MSGTVVLIIVLAVAAVTAIAEAVVLADQNNGLRVKLDRAIDDRDEAAQARARVHLREVVADLREQARWTADRAQWRAFHDAANHIETNHLSQAAPAETGGA